MAAARPSAEDGRGGVPGTVDGTAPGATLAALRERGAQHHDPVRFRFLEALARRTAAQDGAVRQLLEHKLARLIADYAARHAQARTGLAGSAPRSVPAAPRPLAELLQQLGRPARHDSPSQRALVDARSTWSRLSVQRQLRQSLARSPKNAGPLNSHLLLLRSLEAMREASPDYLSHFMSHVDALLWLGAVPGEPAPPAAAAGNHDKRRARPHKH